jgi:hypothetical protein
MDVLRGRRRLGASRPGRLPAIAVDGKAVRGAAGPDGKTPYPLGEEAHPVRDVMFRDYSSQVRTGPGPGSWPPSVTSPSVHPPGRTHEIAAAVRRICHDTALLLAVLGLKNPSLPAGRLRGTPWCVAGLTRRLAVYEGSRLTASSSGCPPPGPFRPGIKNGQEGPLR